ncbi:DUF1127 domain-containing protein [Halovulum sp. GXIMD14794]
MATTTHNTAYAARPTFGERFNAVLRDLRARYEEAKLVRRTEAELLALTDRDLADLGISRYDIPRIAREAARTV